MAGMFLQKFGNGIENNVDLLLKNLIEVAEAIRGLQSQMHAAAVEEQRLSHKFEVGRNSSIRCAIEKLFEGNSGNGVVILFGRTETKARIDAFIPAGGETSFGPGEFFKGLIVNEQAECAF